MTVYFLCYSASYSFFLSYEVRNGMMQLDIAHHVDRSGLLTILIRNQLPINSRVQSSFHKHRGYHYEVNVVSPFWLTSGLPSSSEFSVSSQPYFICNIFSL